MYICKYIYIYITRFMICNYTASMIESSIVVIDSVELLSPILGQAMQCHAAPCFRANMGEYFSADKTRPVVKNNTDILLEIKV